MVKKQCQQDDCNDNYIWNPGIYQFKCDNFAKSIADNLVIYVNDMYKYLKIK